MKKYVAAMALCLTPAVSFATTETELANQFFNNENPKLTSQEKAGLDISKQWQANSGKALKPVSGPDGSVRFPFGAVQPSVVCAVMQVCDIELQIGELVNSVHLGDTVRWTVEPAITGAGPYEVQHLIVKPLDVGLDTTLIVTTNRRTYHIRLRSHRTEFMSRVSFSYPEEAAAKWAALKRAEVQERKINTIPQTGEYLGDLDFNYKISGKARWKPTRVYNDGVKTIIQMPSSMAQTEAPTLMVLREKGGLAKDESVLVNYRVQGNRYIVDTIFDKAVLVAGVGSSQIKVTIEKEKR